MQLSKVDFGRLSPDLTTAPCVYSVHVCCVQHVVKGMGLNLPASSTAIVFEAAVSVPLMFSAAQCEQLLARFNVICLLVDVFRQVHRLQFLLHISNVWHAVQVRK